jgi:hypothetical protein
MIYHGSTIKLMCFQRYICLLYDNMISIMRQSTNNNFKKYPIYPSTLRMNTGNYLNDFAMYSQFEEKKGITQKINKMEAGFSVISCN